VHAMGLDDIYPVRMSKVGCHCTSAVANDLGHRRNRPKHVE